jgi:hypothetical protein
MHRGNQFHEIGFIKQETTVLSKNAVVLNWMSYTQSHETIVAQLLFHVTLCMIYNLKQWHFRLNHSFQFYETDFMELVSSVCDPRKSSSYIPASPILSIPGER